MASAIDEALSIFGEARDAKRVEDADFYRFQVKRQRLAEMRGELDGKRDARRSKAPKRKGFEA